MAKANPNFSILLHHPQFRNGCPVPLKNGRVIRNYADAIKRIRQSLGISRDEMAANLGYSGGKRSIEAIEQGITKSGQPACLNFLKFRLERDSETPPNW